jgi:hypothetical protein
MAVLTTYHKLVERDAKNVDIHWKGSGRALKNFKTFSTKAFPPQ